MAGRNAQRMLDNYHDVFSRLLQATGAHSQTSLALALGVSQPTVNAARTHRTLPDTWKLVLALKFNVNPMWVEEGDRHSRFFIPVDKCDGNIVVSSDIAEKIKLRVLPDQEETHALQPIEIVQVAHGNREVPGPSRHNSVVPEEGIPADTFEVPDL